MRVFDKTYWIVVIPRCYLRMNRLHLLGQSRLDLAIASYLFVHYRVSNLNNLLCYKESLQNVYISDAGDSVSKKPHIPAEKQI